MSKDKELKALEKKRDALNNEIKRLKKSTGQLEFEEYLYNFNTTTNLSHLGEYGINFNNIEISLPMINKDTEVFYKNMAIACKALSKASYGHELGVVVG